jgi:S-(hydroxymethyl)glutathione dehydrogenase/alcohol dehydrogenase
MIKALVAHEPESTPVVVEVELPQLGPEDVRVGLAAAGVCHSDLSMTNGTVTPKFPVVLGHEASGTVLEVGSAVDDLELGAPVVLNWAAPCRKCWFCLHAEPWLCRRVERTISTPGGALADGTPLHLALAAGAFAEETVVPRYGVIPLADGIRADVAALMGCAVLTGFGAVRNTAGVRSGESVVIFGLGGIGLSALLAARMAGAGPIIAVDVNPEKEETARALGATEFLLFDEKIARTIRGLTERRGADHAFECVGRPETIEAAWGSLRRGGHCFVVGVGRREDEVKFSAMETYHYARGLSGCALGSSDPDRDIPMYCAMLASGSLDLQPLISHRTDLDGANDAFERMRRGEGLRTVIEFGAGDGAFA